jgi:hypothetical protein
MNQRVKVFGLEDFQRLEPQALAERAGERNFNGPVDFYSPNPIILANAFGNSEQNYTTHVRMRVPDSRVRVKLSVLFYPTAGDRPADLTEIGTIWVCASEEDKKGISGSGRIVPVTDLEGTSAAPTAFPKTSGLYGYSREFVTAADWIEADIHLVSNADVIGTWVLQARIQPDAVTFSWGEWDQIRRLFEIQNLGGQGSL